MSGRGGGFGELQPLLTRLQARMGRNLMLYQSIEHTLKLILPCLRAQDGQPPFLPANQGQPPTPGTLINAYLRGMQISAALPGDDDEEIRVIMTAQIRSVVEARNILVHCFGATPGVNTYSDGGLREGIRILDLQYAEGLELFDDLAA